MGRGISTLSLSLSSVSHARQTGSVPSQVVTMLKRSDEIEIVDNITMTYSEVRMSTVTDPFTGRHYTVRNISPTYLPVSNKWSDSIFAQGLNIDNTSPIYGPDNVLTWRFPFSNGKFWYGLMSTISSSGYFGIRFGVVNSNSPVDYWENKYWVNQAGLSGQGYGTTFGNSLLAIYCIIDGAPFFGFMVGTWSTDNSQGEQRFQSATGILYSINDLAQFCGELDLGVQEENSDYGDISNSSGYGGYNPSGRGSETIGIPTQPPSISSLGFLNVYKVNGGDLDALINDIFPQYDFPDIPEGEGLGDIVKSLNSMIDAIGNAILQFGNSNLLNDILDCHIIPVNCSGTRKAIKVGYKTTSCFGQAISTDYVDIDCGSINIREVYGNYIDYVGTRAKLFLPFVGFVDVKPEYWQNGTLNVYYRFNVINGSFMCWIRSTSSKSNLANSVIGEYSGNSCVSVPLNGTDYTQVLSGVASAVTSMTLGTATGNVAQMASASNNIMQSMKPTQQHNGSYNMSSSFMGMKRPYLIIEREVPSFSSNYPHEQGLPLNQTVNISYLSGYTVVSNLITDGLTCTQEEQEEIKSLFAKGVLL